MTDETESNGGKTPKSTLEDPRFEVKWRKKGSDSAPPTEKPTESEPAGEEDVDSLRSRLAEAERRNTDLQDRWHRSAADLANLRKRNEAEKGEVEKFASMMLVAELLPVLDNFERALATIPGNLAMLTWIHGVLLTERHLRAILEHQGVVPIEAEGERFNPQLHEAIAETETDAVPAGHIARVYQGGYTMHGRVIRPALVELARAPTGADEEPVVETEPAPEQTAAEAEVENTGP